LIFGGLLFSSVGSYASAYSVKAKPSKPSISSIVAVKSKSAGKVDVTVVFTRAITNKKSPLMLTEVKVGNSICVALKRATRCKVKNVPANKKLIVTARTQNRNGFGARSARVSFIPKAGNKWLRSIAMPVATVPGSVTTVPGSVTTAPSATGLKFNIKSAVGLTLKSTVSSASVRKSATGSNLQTVDATGNTSDAVTSGTASIKSFLIAPNDKLYVVFNSKTTIGAVSCLLAEVAKSTGNPICIDSSLTSIQWNLSGGSSRIPRDPIQFDDAGAIYYIGSTSSSTVLRKYLDGSFTDLVNDNVNVNSFLVRGDGSVFVYGNTVSSNANWVRRISPAGAVSNLASSSLALSMYEMPDNHIWLGLWNSEFGIRRYSLASGAMVPGYWFSSTQTPSFVDSQNLAICVGGSINRSFCGWDGTYVQDIYRIPSGDVYAIAGTGSDGILMRYYPTFAKAASLVNKVSVSQQVLSYVILSGLDVNDKNVTNLYNTLTDTEQVLIPATTEIEVYHLNYVASTNKIMFDGLRFSDNKYVIGQVDLDTKVVTTSQTGSSKLLDFQTFGS